MILWLWDKVIVWLVCFYDKFDCLNDWLEIGNLKDEMKNEWFMIEQQEVVPNERCDRVTFLLTFLLDNLTNYQN